MHSNRAAADTGMTMGEDDTYSIEELAAQAGMTARNVRAYRTRGLLPPPLRRGRITRYDHSHLERLLDVQQLRESGVPLRMITEAAERGADLSQGGDLWRLMVTEDSPWSRSGGVANGREAPAARGATTHDAGLAGVNSVDLRGTEAEPGPIGAPVRWEPLHPTLISHLGNDPGLRDRLVSLGVVSGSGRLLYGSADVGVSLQAITGTGITAATALTVAGQAAEATRALAGLLQDLLSEAGHIVSPTLRDPLIRLTLGVMRDTLAKELDAVR
jgi:DNA-binding transcriptional MerR regulator